MSVFLEWLFALLVIIWMQLTGKWSVSLNVAQHFREMQNHMTMKAVENLNFSYLAQETLSKADVWVFWPVHSFSTFKAKNPKEKKREIINVSPNLEFKNPPIITPLGREDAFPHRSEWRWWGWRWPGGRCFAPRCCPWSLCKPCGSSWMERMKKCHKPELSLCHIYSSISPPSSCYENVLGWYRRPQTCKPHTSSLFMCWTSCTKLHTRAYQWLRLQKADRLHFVHKP